MVQRLGRSCCTDCVLLVNLRGARDGKAFGMNLCARGNGELQARVVFIRGDGGVVDGDIRRQASDF